MKDSKLLLVLACIAAGPVHVLADCPANSIFCDNFNTYCTGGGHPTGAGDPAGPDCVSNGSPDNTLLQSIWFRTSVTESNSTPCGELMVLDPTAANILSFPFAGKVPGNGSQLIGQSTVKDWQSPNPLTLSRFIGNAYGNGANAATGTDAHPLVVSFFVSSESTPNAGRIWYSDGFIELGFGEDNYLNRANTDYGLVADFNNGQPKCCSPAINQGPWPVICSVGQKDNPAVSMPTNCPTTTPPLHNAIAVGILANYDNDPCHCGTAHGGTLYHPVIFDGRQWWQIKTNNPMASNGTITNLDGSAPSPYPTDINQPGRFVLYGGQPPANSGKSMNWITLTIKTTTFNIEMKTREYSPATGLEYYVNNIMTGIPRLYLGPFDRMRAGMGSGCELASSGSWTTCKAGTSRSCLDNNGNQARYVDFDDLSLSGGEGYTTVGACCHMNGTCTQTTPENCVAAGDTHAGPNTSCSTAACCAHGTFVWADTDADGDVDADDFGVFQRCFTGPSGAMSSNPKCKCFDRTGDNDVDNSDYLEFVKCATGTSVPWSPALTPNCTP